MNSSESDNARLEAWLRRSNLAPLPDDGFSARVLAALPSPRPAPSAWRQWSVPALGALAGLAAVLSAGGAPQVRAVATWVNSSGVSILAALFSPDFELTIAVLIAGFSTLYAVAQVVED